MGVRQRTTEQQNMDSTIYRLISHAVDELNRDLIEGSSYRTASALKKIKRMREQGKIGAIDRTLVFPHLSRLEANIKRIGTNQTEYD